MSSSLQSPLLKLKFLFGSLFYLTYAPYAYLYSWTRDRLERQAPPSSETESFVTPGKIGQAEPTPTGACFYFDQAELEITVLAADLVRLDWKPGILPIPYAISKTDWIAVPTTLEETVEGWKLATAQLCIQVSLDGYVRFYDAQGHCLREERPPQKHGEAWQHQVNLKSDERIYGLGERAAHLNLRSPRRVTKKEGFGRETVEDLPPSYRMWNYDAAGMYSFGSDPMYLCIPLYLSLHQHGSYLVFYENSFESTVDLNPPATIAFTGGALRYYVAIGEPAQLLERYTELTGRSPLPPRWALGYHQSRWGYRTEEAVWQTVRQFEDLDLPLSTIHLDIDVQVGFRAFTVDPTRFPRLGTFTRELAAKGIRFITILNPGVKYNRNNNLFLQGQTLDAFCKRPDGRMMVAPVWPGWCVFPDFTNPLVRRWWSRQYEYLLDLGVGGFWHDMNEPAAFIAWGDRSLPKTVLHAMEGRGGDHREAHNLYGLLQARAAYESLVEYRPQERPFIVSRAGWAGLQRYAWTWTGDIECTWEALRFTIATVLNLGLSGIPYSGPDIGGFQGNPTAELFTRWFQLSTFLPFYRTHCSNNVQYRAPWTYGEPYLSIIRRFLKLRYALLPYLYTLAWESHQKGYPLVRPLFWSHPSDARLWDVEDAFLLGDRLLVCPILTEACARRSLILPAGHWYHFWSDAQLPGGQEVELEATLDVIPLLVRAGTTLPMEEQQWLVLHLYPPADGQDESVVYSDPGDGYGAWRCDRFQLIRHPHGVEILRAEAGEYPLPYLGIRFQVHGLPIRRAWVDGNEVGQEGTQWQGDRHFQHAFFEIDDSQEA